MDLDDYANEIGLTRYHIFQVVMLAMQGIAGSMTIQSLALLTAVPGYRCKVPFDNHPHNISEAEKANLTDSCERYDYNYTGCNDTLCLLGQGEVGTIPCDDGWVYDRSVFPDTTVTEWDLVCERRTLSSLASSLFFVGMFIGSGIAGITSDWFGRKVTLYSMGIIRDVANIASAFALWYALWVGIRIVASASLIACTIIRFSLVQEIVPSKNRTAATIIAFISANIPNLFMPFVFEALGNWRTYSLIIGLTGIPLSMFCFFVNESPRWQIIHEKEKKAKQTMKKVCKSAGKVLDEVKWNEIVQVEREKLEKSKESENMKLTYIDLFRYPMTRFITLNIMFGWFVVTMLFYGLIINVTKLSGNPYVNASLNSAVQRISDFALIFSHFFGRRRTLFASYILAGICCILSMVLALNANGRSAISSASSAMAIIGQLFTSTAFGVIYLVTAEVYPTSVRTVGMGIGSMSGRIGSMISPFTLQLQYTVPWLTQTLFGSLAILAGFSSLVYPETRDLGLISNLEETENHFAEQLPRVARVFRINRKRIDPGITLIDGDVVDTGAKL